MEAKEGPESPKTQVSSWAGVIPQDGRRPGFEIFIDPAE